VFVPSPLSESDIQAERVRPALLAFVLAECQFGWSGKLVDGSVWAQVLGSVGTLVAYSLA